MVFSALRMPMRCFAWRQNLDFIDFMVSWGLRGHERGEGDEMFAYETPTSSETKVGNVVRNIMIYYSHFFLYKLRRFTTTKFQFLLPLSIKFEFKSNR